MVDSLFPLKVIDVTVRRRGRAILGPVSVEMGATGLTAVMGPNGSGKTTFLRAIHGVERLSGGSVQWAISDDTARDRQAYVFQHPVMLRRSVRDNLRYPLHLGGITKADAATRVATWLDRTGLSEMADIAATRLSGGERQKLALARALIRQPAVLFLDEPCANLDGRATREIEALLAETLASGTRIMMATHDIGQARRLATDVVFLLSGRIHEQGVAEQMFGTPQTPAFQAFLKGDIVE